MNFKTWVDHFKDVDRPIGDLAKDINRDVNFPDANDRKTIRDYLEKKLTFTSRPNVLEAFDNAWSYYLKDKP